MIISNNPKSKGLQYAKFIKLKKKYLILKILYLKKKLFMN